MKLSRIICLLVLILCFSSIVFGVEYKSGIENFPESYRPYLYALQEKHPNWKFTAMYTGLDWNTATTQESHLSSRRNRLSVSLAPSSWDKAWHYILSNGGTNRVEQGWVTASANAVKFTMDPRNFLNEKTIFEFEELTYNKDIHTLKGVEQILYGTEMSKTVTENGVTKYVIKEIEYYKPTSANNVLKTTVALNLRKSPSVSGTFITTISKGTTVTTIEYTAATEGKRTWAKVRLSNGIEGYACRIDEDGTYNMVNAGNTTTEYVKYIDVNDLDGDGDTTDTLTYAEAYMIAAKKSGVSPYALALRTKNETGCKISSNGQISGKHNAAAGYYNYYSIGAYGANPMENGVLYAKAHGWDNPVKAMIEGAKFWGESYILAKQNTPYLQKYNVNTETKNGLYSHQYMTDITCVYREAIGMYDTYSSLKILNNEFTFIIPVYNNMPNEPYHVYLDYEDYFEKDVDTVTTNKATSIYSLVPTSGGIQRIEMCQVPAGTKLTKLASGMASSYDRVKYTVDGADMYGFVFYTNYDLTKTEDNTKMQVIASPWVRLRSAPNTSSSQVCLLYTGNIVTRIEKNSAVNSTGIWDKVVTDSGKTGYVCRVYKDGADVYLKEVSYVKVEGVSFEKETYELNMGTTVSLVVNITPTNAKYKGVTFKSSDESIIKVDENGVVTPIKAGEATVTVKTNDQLKTATCKIIVKPVLVSDKEKYIVKLDDSIDIKLEVKGIENANIQVKIEDENIAKYENGKIIGLAIGNTKAQISVADVEELSKAVELEVVEKINEEELTVEFDKSLKNTEGTLTGIKPETKVEDLLKCIKTNGSVKVYNSDGKEVTDGIVGTDTKIVVELSDKKSEYAIVVCGDTNGDGLINSADLLKIVKYLKNGGEINKNAADVNKDNDINSADLLKIVKYLKGTGEIDFI